MLGNTQNNSTNLFILKPTDKDDDKRKTDPHFNVITKNNDKWGKTMEVNRVSGKVSSVVIKEKEWEGKKYETINILLNGKNGEGENEAYMLDLRWTIATRALLNSLLALEDPNKEITISVYKNKKDYLAMNIFQDGKSISWKYGLEEIPEPRKVNDPETGEVIRTDFSKTDGFFREKLVKFADRLNSASSVEDGVEHEDETEDDVPF